MDTGSRDRLALGCPLRDGEPQTQTNRASELELLYPKTVRVCSLFVLFDPVRSVRDLVGGWIESFAKAEQERGPDSLRLSNAILALYPKEARRSGCWMRCCWRSRGESRHVTMAGRQLRGIGGEEAVKAFEKAGGSSSGW